MYTDLITKIKNAKRAGKRTLKTRFNSNDKSISDTLQRSGFVGQIDVKGRPSKRFIFVDLKSARYIQGVKFHSKPSARIYIGYKEIKKVKNGFGVSVLSTPKGVMTGAEARRLKVGGEFLFEIW